MSKPDIKAVIAEAMAFLGSKKSPRKTAAARRNAKLPPKKGSKPRGRPRSKKAGKEKAATGAPPTISSAAGSIQKE